MKVRRTSGKTHRLEALETYATVPATALAWTPSALLVGGTTGCAIDRGTAPRPDMRDMLPFVVGAHANRS